MGQRNSWNETCAWTVFRWCANSGRIAKVLTARNSQMPCGICENRKRSCGNQLDLGSCEGEMLEDGCISELILEIVGPLPSEYIFPIVNKCMTVGKNESNCTTKCPDKQRLREELRN